MKRDEFRKGDKVFCVGMGWGKVVEVVSNIAYPILVKFAQDYGAFTKDGSYDEEEHQSLFFEEIKIPDSAYLRARWRANIDDTYFYVDSFGDTYKTSEGSIYASDRYNAGNYFKTEEEAIASKFYKVFHE